MAFSFFFLVPTNRTPYMTKKNNKSYACKNERRDAIYSFIA